MDSKSGRGNAPPQQQQPRHAKRPPFYELGKEGHYGTLLNNNDIELCIAEIVRAAVL